MSDQISILVHSSMHTSKTWNADGTITAFGSVDEHGNEIKAKYFKLVTKEVSDLKSLSALLTKLETKPKSLIIRGAYVGDEQAQEQDPQYQEGKVRRTHTCFADQALHMIMFDIDGYEPMLYNPLLEPEQAISEYIADHIPEFAVASYHWQMSSSMGHPTKKPNELRCHLWFWLKNPYKSCELKAWADACAVETDTKLFDTVQIHYTAGPVFAEGVTDPVPARSGFYQGTVDEVDLTIAPEVLEQARDVSGSGIRIQLTPEQVKHIEETDPILKVLVERGMLKKTKRRDGGWNVECPRKEHHSDGGAVTGETATVYYPPVEGEKPFAAFKCMHSHCSNAKLDEFLEELGIESNGKAGRTAEYYFPKDMRLERMDELKALIDNAASLDALEIQVMPAIANSAGLLQHERDALIVRIITRSEELGSKYQKPFVTQRTKLRPAAVVEMEGGFALPDIDEDGRPQCTLENFKALMRHLGITIRYNVIRKKDEVLIPGKSFSMDNGDNATLAYILSECERAKISTRHVDSYVLTVADENAYNPVGVWIESRPWDKVSRLQDFYDTVISDDPLKNVLMKKWAIQAVASALSPEGIAGQSVLVFVGDQGVGKTSWFKNLVDPNLNLVKDGHILQAGNKDTELTALEYWIVELGELDATFRKSDISYMKGFITKAKDSIRRPFARKNSNMPRRTVFGGSVNQTDYLNDPTGSRRYFSIQADAVVYNHTIDMQQFWAEIRVLWDKGEQYWLTPEEMAELTAHNLDYTQKEPVVEAIESALDWHDESLPRVGMTVTEILILAGYNNGNISKKLLSDASHVIRKLTGQRRARRTNGKDVYDVPRKMGIVEQLRVVK